MTTRELAVDYALRFIGRPYLWGGDDPMAGFDCSGFVVEVLLAAGLLEYGADYNAEGLRQLWPQAQTWARPGDLVFWIKDGRATHVELAISATHTIGASGGGSATTSLEEAIRRNAFVKIRPITFRGPDFIVAWPPY